VAWRARIGVGDGDGQGVRRVGRGGGIETHECADHDGDLCLAGGAVAGDGSLYGLRGVFDHGDAVACYGKDCGPSGATQRDCDDATLDINRLFNGRARWAVGADDFRESVVDGDEAFAEGQFARV